MMRTDDATLAEAMRRLAKDIHTCDGVANQAIAEAAERINELSMALASAELKTAALCDLEYANGAKSGFKWGQHDDVARLEECIEKRVPDAVRTLIKTRNV